MKQSELNTLLKGVREASMRKARFSVGDTRDIQGAVQLHKMKAIGTDNMSMKVREFQKQSDLLLLTSNMMFRKGEGPMPIEKLGAFAGFQSFIENDSELKKAMTTSTQSYWIPTDFSRDFVDQVSLQLKVAALFPEIAMVRGTQDFSQKADYSTAYKKTEGSNGTASPNITDTKGTLSASTIMDFIEVSDELEQDAAFAQAPMIRQDAINAIARAIEDCIINGDTTATHMDSDVVLSYSHRACWKGLRKLALANTYTTDLSTLNADTLTALLGSMGVFGADPSQLALVIGVKGRVKMINLKDNQNNKVYLENGTPGAMDVSMVPGSVGALAGSAVILSEFIREDLNASGVYDGTTKTKGSMLWVRKDGFVRGVVNSIKIETDRNIQSQVNQLAVSTRMDFQPRYAIATNKVVWMGYNI
jgi:HK97 family phage major capsid protein